jgi:hypothetical protein
MAIVSDWSAEAHITIRIIAILLFLGFCVWRASKDNTDAD